MSRYTYSTYSFPSVQKPETIAGYAWSVVDPQAVVFLVHGFRSHARYNYLRNDSPDSLHQYGDESSDLKYPDIPKSKTSLIRELNERHLSVFAHDAVGHGESTGLRSYFSSFQTLVDDLMQNVHLKNSEYNFSQNNVPIFLLGHSLGGTVSIAASIQNPTLFSGMILSSAATAPPANMFGLVGQIQYMLSGVTSFLIPTVPVVEMPKNDNKVLQNLYESDPLNTTLGIRSRVGRELIVAYNNIANSVEQVKIPFFTVSGENDTLVNPKAAEHFYERAASTDKKYMMAKGRWHNLLIEDGCEEIWKDYSDWLSERGQRPGNK